MRRNLLGLCSTWATYTRNWLISCSRREISSLNLFRSPAKKLISAKRTSYKLAVWLYSDNDCNINNRVYDLFGFPALPVMLLLLSRFPITFSWNRLKAKKMWEKKREGCRGNLVQTLTALLTQPLQESRAALLHSWLCSQTSKEHEVELQLNKFDYAKCNPFEKLLRSLSQQRVIQHFSCCAKVSSC